MSLRECVRWGRGVLLLLALLLTAAAQEKKEADPREAPPPAEPESERPDEPVGDVLPMQSTGGHTGMIQSLAFDRGGERLFTAGAPGEVAEWDVQSGERLRVWRFPRPVSQVAAFPDGKRLAVAGLAVQAEKTAVWLIDLLTSEVTLHRTVDGGTCRGLAVAPDGKRLAVSLGQHTDVLPLEGKAAPVVLEKTGKTRSMSFDPSGRWLLTATRDRTGGKVRVWSASGSTATKGKKAKQGDIIVGAGQVHIPTAAWSADGKRIVAAGGGKSPSVAVWSFATAARLKPDWKAGSLKLKEKGNNGEHVAIAVASVSDNEAIAALSRQGVLKLVRIGLKKERIEILPNDIPVQSKFTGQMAVSPDGRWLAVTTDPAFQVALYDLKNRKEVRRFGPRTRVPRTVAWTARGDGIGWSYQERAENKDGQPAVSEGVDLARMERLYRKDLDGARGGPRPPKSTIVHNQIGRAYLVRNGKKVGTNVWGAQARSARLFKDIAGKEWLLLANRGGQQLSIVDLDTGKTLDKVGGTFPGIYDIAVSPDQKYLLVAGGGMEVDVFALDRPQKPLLHVMGSPGGDWVAWTDQGYYAGTPGGEKLFGWKVVSGPDQLATFHPASRFRKQLYRADLIGQVLAKGSLEAALKQVGQARAAKVDELLPPVVAIVDVDKTKLPSVTVRVKAKGTSQSVVSLRLMLNGRPLAEDRYQVDLGEKGKPEHEQTWTLEVPEGKSELSVLARSADSLAVSEAKEITFRKPPASRLFALCVGVNQYRLAKLNLKAACNDAREVAEALRKHCGKAPLFAEASAELLLDEKATKKGVLEALAALRAKGGIKPTDLVVLFFACHGVKEKQEFYLLTHEADVKDFKGSCVSGAELRKALAALPCQVLLLLDACHSGAAGGALNAYRPATDEATRALTDEEVGVVVMAAAMDHEHALEKGVHGFFAGALIDGMARAQGVPCNFRDKHVYVHHLFSYAFDRVKDQSEDKQHPSLNLPSTVESFPLVP
jgi:WD40 repeat protein